MRLVRLKESVNFHSKYKAAGTTLFASFDLQKKKKKKKKKKEIQNPAFFFI